MGRSGLIIAAVLAGPLTAGPAAAGFLQRAPSGEPMHDCTCRLAGQNVPLGERRCLMTPNGPRTAECVMVLNNTSWQPGPDACPQASLVAPRG